MIDWLGGYPFEVVSPAKMNDHAVKRGFELINSCYTGFGMGCNEYVYRRTASGA
jgi:2-polyprenyl-6-hydroxyphenyl methylase/3-demethylubiquinone-9 3-methyltransferase